MDRKPGSGLGQLFPDDELPTAMNCPACEAIQIVGHPCRFCDGAGRVTPTKAAEIRAALIARQRPAK